MNPSHRQSSNEPTAADPVPSRGTPSTRADTGKRHKRVLAAKFWATITPALLLAACASDAELGLLGHPSQAIAPTERTAEEERLHRLQAIVVVRQYDCPEPTPPPMDGGAGTGGGGMDGGAGTGGGGGMDGGAAVASGGNTTVDPATTCDPSPQQLEMTSSTLADDLYFACEAQLSQTVADLSFPSGCSRAKVVPIFLCTAQQLLNAASVRAAPVQVTVDSSSGYTTYPYNLTIPNQSTATNAAMARLASRFASRAMGDVFDIIRHKVSLPDLPQANPDPNLTPCEPTTTAQWSFLSQHVLDAYQVYQEAIATAARASIASADAQRSTAASSGEAARRVMAAKQISRSAAAHLYQFGPEGFKGKTSSQGFCTTARPSRDVQAATDMIRQTALAPAAIVGSVSIAHLLNGSTVDLASGSVRARGIELWGAKAFQDSSNTTITVQEATGISTQSFVTARERIKQELNGFDRSKLRTLPAVWTPAAASDDDEATDFKRYAGVATEPARLPEVYTAGLTRWPMKETHGNVHCDEHNNSICSDFHMYGDTGVPSFEPRARLCDEEGRTSYCFPEDDAELRPLDVIIDAALTSAIEIKGEEARLTSAEKEAILPPLYAILSDGESRRVSRVTVCRRTHMAEEQLRVEAAGFTMDDDVRIMVGLDGLRCAVDGAIEGSVCSKDPDFNRSDATSPTTPGFLFEKLDVNVASPADGFSKGASTDWDMRATAQTGVLYLVKRKRDSAGNLLAEAPGNYEALTALHDPMQFTATMPAPEIRCYTMSLVKDAAEAAARALAPSTDWCAQSEVTCAGEELGARMPLENELASDNTDVESSWRHYLTLARQAADEADLLGQRMLDQQQTLLRRDEDTKLSFLSRSENAVDELQDICGLRVDPDLLWRTLGATPDTDGLLQRDLSLLTRAGACSGMGTQCSTLAGGRCVGGTCVVSVGELIKDKAEEKEDGSWGRLHGCLGSSESLEFASLGTAPVCLWYKTSDPHQLCKNLGGEHSTCPRILDSGSCTAPAGNTAHTINGDKLLGLFDNSDGHAGAGTQVNCDDIRTIRGSSSTNAAAFRRLKRSGFFHPARILDSGRRLGWDAHFGGYSTISINGRPSYTTGNTTTGRAIAGWPCDATPSWATCSGMSNPSLFCTTVNCATANERAQMNERMGWAVAVARETTMRDSSEAFDRIRVPALVSPSLFQTGPVNQTIPEPVVRARHVANPAGGSFAVPLEQKDYRLGPRLARRYDVNGATLVGWRSGAGVDYHVPSEGSTEFSILDGAASFRPREATHVGLVGTIYQDYPVESWWHGMSLGGSGVRNGFGQGYYAAVLQKQPASLPYPIYATNLGDRGLGLLPIPQDREAMMLDGLELLCDSAQRTTGECNLSSPPEVSTVDDLGRAGHYLSCVGDEIERRSALMVLRDFPKQALDPLRTESTTGAFPVLGGKLGSSVSVLRAQLAELASVAPLIGEAMRGLGSDLDVLRLSIGRAEIKADLADVTFMSRVANQVTSCYRSMIPTTVPNAGGLLMGGLLSCANAAAQIKFAGRIQELTAKETQLARELSLVEFRDRFEKRASDLNQMAFRVNSAIERIEATLAEVESLRERASRALVRSLYMDSKQMNAQYELGSFLRSRLLTSQERYKEARANAVRMAFLAKRAVEQRLGLHLAEMHDDLPLVSAPATWEASICDKAGVDHTSLIDQSVKANFSFADAYIGDYVTRLENVVESYRLTHAFHEGEDTAVISLRDEIHNVRDTCDVPVGNLLYFAGQLDRYAAAGSTDAGWQVTGCAVDANEDPLPNCVAAVPLGDTSAPSSTWPPTSKHADLGAVEGYRIAFGPVPVTPPTPEPPDGLQSSTALVQKVDVLPGTYRLSWYGKNGQVFGDASKTTNAGHMVAVKMTDGAGTAVLTQPANTGDDNYSHVSRLCAPPGDDMNCTGTAGGRYYFQFEVKTEQTIAVQIMPKGSYQTGMAAPVLESPHYVDLGAIMLEDISQSVGSVSTSDYPKVPKVFADTSESLSRPLRVCEDTTGEQFRGTRWRRDCLLLCEDGFYGDCGLANAQTHCFYETSFNINPRDIDSGKIIHTSGFARGNFNYRIDSIGLNFVGVGTRDCSSSAFPSTCLSGGHFPYSLDHVGPYVVRNHQGRDFRASLFTGHIEHARGLASERYITNPISSTDHALLDRYMRKEFRGRPLDGTFVLRVWEEPGVNFDALEDVQVVLDYRYWTRFN